MLIAYDTVHDTSDIHSETNVRFSENFKFFTAGQKSEKNQPYKSFFFQILVALLNIEILIKSNF